MASLNQCSGCDKNFAGSTTHALHRVGSFQQNTRRCLTTEELLAKGWTRQVEPVKRLREGKEYIEQMETWYRPMTEQRRASLDALRAKGKRSGDEEEELVEETL